jgi:hypothetical protein
MSCSCFITGIQNLEEVVVFRMTLPVNVAQYLSPRSDYGLIPNLTKILYFVDYKTPSIARHALI